MLDRKPAVVDIAVSLALIAIAAAFLYDARELPPGMFEPVGPGPIPSAVAWCVIALAVYVIVQAVVRLATGMLPPREPPAFETRGVDAAVVSALLIAYVAVMGLGLVRTKFPVLQVVRGVVLVGSTVCFYGALRFLPLAEAASISFVAPVLVTAFSGPLLRERVTKRQWGAVILGLQGYRGAP